MSCFLQIVFNSLRLSISKNPVMDITLAMDITPTTTSTKALSFSMSLSLLLKELIITFHFSNISNFRTDLNNLGLGYVPIYHGRSRTSKYHICQGIKSRKWYLKPTKPFGDVCSFRGVTKCRNNNSVTIRLKWIWTRAWTWTQTTDMDMDFLDWDTGFWLNPGHTFKRIISHFRLLSIYDVKHRYIYLGQDLHFFIHFDTFDLLPLAVTLLKVRKVMKSLSSIHYRCISLKPGGSHQLYSMKG